MHSVQQALPEQTLPTSSHAAAHGRAALSLPHLRQAQQLLDQHQAARAGRARRRLLEAGAAGARCVEW